MGHGRRFVTRMRELCVLVAAMTLLVGGCGGGSAPLQAAVDELTLPSTWEVAKTVVQGGSSGCIAIANPNCPSVTRYFVVTGDLPDLFQEARTAVVAGGFSGLEELSPECDRDTSGAPCGINATKGDIRIQIDLYRPGQDVDSLGVAIPEHPTVRVILR